MPSKVENDKLKLSTPPMTPKTQSLVVKPHEAVKFEMPTQDGHETWRDVEVLECASVDRKMMTERVPDEAAIRS